MPGLFLVTDVMVVTTCTVMLIQLRCAVRSLEFMALARDTGQADGQQQQEEWFHRAAS